MKVCPICKTQFMEGASFCPVCNTMLMQQAEETKETQENKAQRIKDWGNL
ncbi:MAG: hypothetical protein ACYCX2_11165 [Christensenellales bacterium]